MLGSIRGKAISFGINNVIVETGGIGYCVFVVPSILSALSSQPDDVFLWTHMITSENGMFLYGFDNKDDIELFQKLMTVNKVGAKMAMGILSYFTTSEIIEIVQNADTKKLSAVPGVGQKTAATIILTLTGKLTNIHSATSKKSSVSKVEQDIIDGLVGMGIKASIAKTAIQNVLDNGLSVENNDISELLRAALQEVKKTHN